ADRQPHECCEGDLYCCQCPHRPAPGLPRYVSFQIPRTFALLRGSLGGLLGYRPGLRAGCLLAVPDQTAEELTKRSYVLTDARGFGFRRHVLGTADVDLSGAVTGEIGG